MMSIEKLVFVFILEDLNFLFMAVGKDKMVNVRLSEKAHEEFKIAAQLRGASMSGLLHQFIVKTVREEKEREPRAFVPQLSEQPQARIINTFVAGEIRADESGEQKERETKRKRIA